MDEDTKERERRQEIGGARASPITLILSMQHILNHTAEGGH